MDEIIKELIAGKVVAIPTDTVYGLATTLEKTEALFSLKKRAKDQPILILAASLDQITPYLLDPPDSFFELAKGWPGALTLILPVKERLPEGVTLGGTAGFRIPDHPLTLSLLEKVGPLAVTSANISGYPSAITSGGVREVFGNQVSILEGGRAKGIPSKILKWDGQDWVCLRR